MFGLIKSRIGLLIVLAAVGALLGVGWYVSTLRHEISSLRASVSFLEAEVHVRDIKIQKDSEIYARSTKSTNSVRSGYRELQEEVERRLQNEDAKDWGNTELPDSIVRLLSPKDSPN